MIEKHYTVTHICNTLRLHRNTVINWIHAGKLRAVRIGRDWRIPESEIARIMSVGVIDPDDLKAEGGET